MPTGWATDSNRVAGAGGVVPQLPFRFDLVAVEPGGRLRHHRHGA